MASYEILKAIKLRSLFIHQVVSAFSIRRVRLCSILSLQLQHNIFMPGLINDLIPCHQCYQDLGLLSNNKISPSQGYTSLVSGICGGWLLPVERMREHLVSFLSTCGVVVY